MLTGSLLADLPAPVRVPASEVAAARPTDLVQLVLDDDPSLRVAFVSRSDSTLRGHCPLETDVLREAIVEHGGTAPHLTVPVPAFADAGRITVDSVHYWVVDDEATPVGETPFYDDEGAEVLSRLDIFVKDLGIVGAAARAHHLAAPVAAAAGQLFLLGEAQGLGALDDSAVIRVVAPSLREHAQG